MQLIRGVMMGRKEKVERSRFAENGIGNDLKITREARGYAQKEICDGICSLATFSRIETGGRVVDFLMIEAFLGRMKIEPSEYEFVLDDADYFAYRQRERIGNLVGKGEEAQAEEELAAYGERYGTEGLHGQFLDFQRGLLAQTGSRPDREKSKSLFLKALEATAPSHREKFRQREILSNLELRCMAEIISCTQNSVEREKEYDELYAYFAWGCRREWGVPAPYRIAMQYYAECLYENGKYEKSILICDEALEELYGTSKLENRGEIFLVRAKAREARAEAMELKAAAEGANSGAEETEDEKAQAGERNRRGRMEQKERRQCLRDFLTAYTIFSFYEGEDNKEAKKIRQHLEEKYQWPFIDWEI